MQIVSNTGARGFCVHREFLNKDQIYSVQIEDKSSELGATFILKNRTITIHSCQNIDRQIGNALFIL